MLTETDVLAIEQILAILNPERLSKMHLRKLQAIKNKYSEIKDNRCLCAVPDRVKFYNEFNVWYQKNA